MDAAMESPSIKAIRTLELLERLYRNTVAESSSPGWFAQHTQVNKAPEINKQWLAASQDVGFVILATPKIANSKTIMPKCQLGQGGLQQKTKSRKFHF